MVPAGDPAAYQQTERDTGQLRGSGKENPMDLNKIEINLDELEQVTGGVVTDKAEKVLRALISSTKKYNYDMDSVVSFVRNNLSFDNINLENTTRDEAVQFVMDHWNEY